MKNNPPILAADGSAVVQGPQGAHLRYFTTTRQTGTSQGPWDSWNLGLHCGDSVSAVHQNRKQLEALVPGPIHWLNQVHGTDVVEFKNNGPHAATSFTADAAFTRDAHCVLAILTADCLPIVISDRENGIVGVAHAGWRGLAGGVLSRLAEAMQRYCQPEQWFAWVGPAIGAAHFEVGQEVYEAFVAQAPQDRQCFHAQPVGARGEPKWLADLPALAQLRLQRSFAAPVLVEQSRLCTYAQPGAFYSYRRDGITGRMATVAWLSSTT